MRNLAILILLLLTSTAGAQTSAVEVISIEQGLSQGFVAGICEDPEGLMWFATSNGLNRYDGYDFLVFKNDPYDPYSLSENNLSWVSEVGDFLFIVTETLALNLYHRKSQRFFRVPLSTPLKEQNLVWVASENDHTLWLCFLNAEGKALFRLQWQENLSEQFEQGTPENARFSFEAVQGSGDFVDAGLSEDKKKLWILSRQDLQVRNLATGTTTTINAPPLMPGLARILPDLAGAVWVFQRGAMLRYDGASWQSFSYGSRLDEFIEANREFNTAWFSAGTKVYGLDLSRLPDQSPAQSIVYQLSIPERVRSGRTDSKGNVWFGTDARGIRKFSPSTSIFKNYLAGNSIYSQPVPAGQNKVLLGDVRRGPAFCGVLDLTTGQLQTFEEMGLPVKPRAHATTDDQGLYWLYSNPYSADALKKAPTLMRFDPATGEKKIYPLPEHFYISSVAMNYRSPGQIWIANTRQLVRFDINAQTFTLFEYNCPIDWTDLFAMQCSPDGTWWIGTNNGLLKGVPAGAGFQFTVLKNDLSNRKSLPENQIKSLLPDPADANVLWIGTANRGLCRLDLRNNQFTHYTTRNGLPDDVVYGILADDERPHKLWISTNRGLTRFSPETGLFQYFFKSDGLQDDEFNTYAAAKSASGQLLFGGVNGLTVFHPGDLSISSNPPNVRITALKINGSPVSPRDSASVLKTDILFAESLILPYWQNNFLFHFAATDYTNPQRNQFAFYLEGTEDAWAHRGFEHTAQYLNLPPGTYTFRVKAANSNGVWNEVPVSLRIVIQPPWYLSWSAYVLYALLLAGAAYSFYRIQLKRKLERAEADRLKEMDEFKSRFFTNISHEFRTPLTVILGTTERLTADGGGLTERDSKNNLGLIQRSGENLLRLVNQILDLAKLESNTLTINYIQGNVPTYLSYVAESLHSLANARNVLLLVENKKPEIIMDYDPERLLQIVYNLLSNAIKFTPSGGKVVMKIDLAADAFGHNQPALRLTVADTGAGIPEADKAYLFDRFFQARNQEFAKSGGSGIGLSLTKELVKAMGGSISVESQEGAGATFIVLLPIRQNAPLGQWQDAGIDESQLSAAASGLQRALPGKHGPDSGLPSLLIIEDNPDVVEYLGACLESDYQLEYAYNGRAGIEKAIEMIPDIIISDVMMPEKDGFEVCEALKFDERTSHIPIILLTAKATVDDRIAGLRRGADAYIAKPFHRKELLATLSGLIELRKKLQQRYASAQSALPPAPDAGVQMEDAFLSRIHEAVEERLGDSGLSGEDICRQLGMSYPVVYRKLSALTGRSLNVYIRLIRLQKACELLSDASLTVSEIAYRTGFNDPKFFSRVFAEEFKTTPTEFRKTLS